MQLPYEQVSQSVRVGSQLEWPSAEGKAPELDLAWRSASVEVGTWSLLPIYASACVRLHRLAQSSPIFAARKRVVQRFDNQRCNLTFQSKILNCVAAVPLRSQR